MNTMLKIQVLYLRELCHFLTAFYSSGEGVSYLIYRNLYLEIVWGMSLIGRRMDSVQLYNYYGKLVSFAA